jgi:hypothetical protein
VLLGLAGIRGLGACLLACLAQDRVCGVEAQFAFQGHFPQASVVRLGEREGLPCFSWQQWPAPQALTFASRGAWLRFTTERLQAPRASHWPQPQPVACGAATRQSLLAEACACACPFWVLLPRPRSVVFISECRVAHPNLLPKSCLVRVTGAAGQGRPMHTWSCLPVSRVFDASVSRDSAVKQAGEMSVMHHRDQIVPQKTPNHCQKSSNPADRQMCKMQPIASCAVTPVS